MLYNLNVSFTNETDNSSYLGDQYRKKCTMQHFDFNNPVCNLKERRLYLHETFLTEKIPEIAASSLVRGSSAASPQSQGNIAKILQRLLNSK